MWEPRRLTTIWASKACYRDSFTFLPGSLNFVATILTFVRETATNSQHPSTHALTSEVELMDCTCQQYDHNNKIAVVKSADVSFHRNVFVSVKLCSAEYCHTCHFFHKQNGCILFIQTGKFIYLLSTRALGPIQPPSQ
jgi:hypothetical protein